MSGAMDIKDTSIIKASSTEGGSITPAGDCFVKNGEDSSFTITAGAGCYIEKILVDNQEITFEKETTTYTYTFESVNKNHTIEAIFDGATIQVPSNFKETATTTNSLKLSWSKVSDAKGYFVYRKEKGKKWSSTPLAKVSASNLTYTDTTAKAGIEYVYAVTSYRYVADGLVESLKSSYVHSHIHKYTTLKTVKPSASSKGYTIYQCNLCDKQYKDKYTTLNKNDTFTVSNIKYKITTKDKKVTVLTGTDKTLTSLKINDTVKYSSITYQITSIADNAFKNYTKLTKVSGCKKITEIGKNAFYNCQKLIQIGDTKNTLTLSAVVTIKEGAFQKCKSLTKVNLTSLSLKTLEKNAFAQNTSLTSFTEKSKQLQTIGEQCFVSDSKLATITLATTSLSSSKNIGKNAFKNIKSTAQIKVPSAKLTPYKKYLANKGQGKKVKITK
jgi:hypothetical protein